MSTSISWPIPGSMWYGRASTRMAERSSRAHHSSTSRDRRRRPSENVWSARNPAATARAISAGVSPGSASRSPSKSCLGTSFGSSSDTNGRDVADPLLGEDVALLEEAGLDVLGRGHDARAGEAPGDVAAQEGRQVVDHRREDDVELLPLPEDELAVVPGDALHRVAAVHRPAALAELAPLLLRGVGREHEVARIDAEGGEEPVPELVRRPEVQDARDADPELSARRVRSGRGGRRPCEPSRQR